MPHYHFASPLTGVELHNCNLHVCYIRSRGKALHYGIFTRNPSDMVLLHVGISKSTYTYILNLKFENNMKVVDFGHTVC